VGERQLRSSDDHAEAGHRDFFDDQPKLFVGNPVGTVVVDHCEHDPHPVPRFGSATESGLDFRNLHS
jgi:hypothetical protein